MMIKKHKLGIFFYKNTVLLSCSRDKSKLQYFIVSILMELSPSFSRRLEKCGLASIETLTIKCCCFDSSQLQDRKCLYTFVLDLF